MTKRKAIRRGELTDDVTRAHLRVSVRERAAAPLTPYLTGKFCEHLGNNIYNGMHAQVLRNPTFAEHLFGAAGRRVDGGVKFQCDEERIAEQVKHFAERWVLPPGGWEQLLESRADGLAFPWVREGAREAVRVSPDVGPAGGRAQRVEVLAGGEGVVQWTYLPLHRVRAYEFRLVARSADLTSLTVTLAAEGQREVKAEARVTGLSRRWGTFTGELVLDGSAPAEALYRLSVTASGTGQFVLGRVLLYPADHVHGNDPDVIRFLRDSQLPILRWPGGNFVSGYHWEDGVGPADSRPTRPNPAWSGVEPNLFGTDEFITFCRDVGCEPLICLNAGDGTPAEAARWVEYCNGSPKTQLGALRAAHGHAEPFDVRYWEIGNELSGRHQINWTTPAGYADRYREFAEAMLLADPSIKLIACGEPPWLRRGWNEMLIGRDADILRSICDHILVGGHTDPATDPSGVFQDFMAFPGYCEMPYTELAEKMRAAGVAEPRLAVTELQLFATLGQPKGDAPVRVTRENLVSPDTLAEALYDVLVYHGAVRLAPLVEMVTQSATVNHGGGLRKERERVYANPCHYGQKMFACFNGATPVTVALECGRERLPRVMPDSIRAKVPMEELPVLDAVAAIGADGALLISVVHRGLTGPVTLTIELEGARPAGPAQVQTLTAEVPWARNTLADPEAVVPRTSTAKVSEGALTLTVPRYSVTVIRLPGK
jgi:alpha-N-arabinofuranosidase